MPCLKMPTTVTLPVSISSADTQTYPAAALLGELSGVAKFFLVTGYTDMRKSIDGLMAIVRDVYELDPYSNSLFLFCGRSSTRIKGLLWEGDGFLLLYKRVESGHFTWPRSSTELRSLSAEQFHWLMQGFSIDPVIHDITPDASV